MPGRILWSRDGLALSCCDWPGAAGRLPLLCLAGLTRNSRDFYDLCVRLDGERRVMAPDYRGRGESARDPEPARYTPESCVADILCLLEQAEPGRFVILGSSLGGILAMMLAREMPGRLAGIILNDIGAVVSRRGLARIRDRVSAPVRHASREEALRALAGVFSRDQWPDADQAFLERELWRSHRCDPGTGAWFPDCDPGVGRVFAAGVTGGEDVDLWPLFRHPEDIPIMLVRGALSDILEAETVAAMKAARPDLACLEIPRRGHLPLPEEDAFFYPLQAFLHRLDGAEG